MITANVATLKRVASVEQEKKVYRLTVQRDHYTFGIWTADICLALDFIFEHENETIYLEIL